MNRSNVISLGGGTTLRILMRHFSSTGDSDIALLTMGNSHFEFCKKYIIKNGHGPCGTLSILTSNHGDSNTILFLFQNPHSLPIFPTLGHHINWCIISVADESTSLRFTSCMCVMISICVDLIQLLYLP